MYPRPDAQQAPLPSVGYDELFSDGRSAPVPLTSGSLGDFLRYALGLSAWKAFRGSRWSLRVNPSSGNLHPTEAYIVTGPLENLSDHPGVWHYASDQHAIEQRCAFADEAWRAIQRHDDGAATTFLVALTSIHWRESWKYGERAFRYCQHDLGHAIAALSISAALYGWRVTILPSWPHRAISTLVGLDRDQDFIEAEREEPACLLLVTNGSAEGWSPEVDQMFLDAVRAGSWFGRASQLSEDHIEWTFIDEIARATEDPGGPPHTPSDVPAHARAEGQAPSANRPLDARAIILQRRSAVAFDGISSTDRQRFEQLLERVMPAPGAPWDAMWWPPRIHLALFVHRVTGFEPGLYLLTRGPATVPRLKAAFHRSFLWEPAPDLPLWLLDRGDYRIRSKRLSCDQDIAADGFFSLAMIADFESSLLEQGAWFYRQLFWEAGVVGQVLYLEAEAAGARATGIGCFYDDPVHELLGLTGHEFQSLYHFTVGTPVEDTRLTTEPGYQWEKR